MDQIKGGSSKLKVWIKGVIQFQNLDKRHVVFFPKAQITSVASISGLHFIQDNIVRLTIKNSHHIIVYILAIKILEVELVYELLLMAS